MAVSKVTLNNEILMDVTDATASADKVLRGYTSYIASGQKVTGSAAEPVLNIVDELDSHGGTVRTITALQGVSVDDMAMGSNLSGNIVLETPTKIEEYAFKNFKTITGVHAKAVTYVGGFIFASGLIYFVCESNITGGNFNAFNGVSTLKYVDINYSGQFSNGFFTNCGLLDTLILRQSNAISRIAGLNGFNNTPFASGGSGGTIYIPKVLYDHLDDGSEYDYKSATNWSVLDGYGTITWAQIEGSYYETHYADGTLIPTGGD